MAARLKETYKSEVAPALMKKFGYKSVMQIPKLDKIVINVGCGEARENSKVVDAIISDLRVFAGFAATNIDNNLVKLRDLHNNYSQITSSIQATSLFIGFF